MERLRGYSIAESPVFVAILSSEALPPLIRPDSVIATFGIVPQYGRIIVCSSLLLVYQSPYFSVNCSLLSSSVEKGRGSILT